MLFRSIWGLSNSSYSLGLILAGFVLIKGLVFKDEFTITASIPPLISVAIFTIICLVFPSPTILICMSLLIGFFSELKEMPKTLLLQKSVPENDLIHIYSFFESFQALLFAINLLFMSFLAQYFPIQYCFILSIACLLAEAGWIWYKKDLLTETA